MQISQPRRQCGNYSSPQCSGQTWELRCGATRRSSRRCRPDHARRLHQAELQQARALLLQQRALLLMLLPEPLLLLGAAQAAGPACWHPAEGLRSYWAAFSWLSSG